MKLDFMLPDDSELVGYGGFNEKSTDNSILSQIRELQMNRSKSFERDEDSALITKTVKKKKKDKKKEKKTDSIFEETELASTEDSDVTIIDAEEIELMDCDEIEQYLAGDISDLISSEQKGNYSKLKQSSDFKKEFAEELTMLYDLLDETKKFGNILEKKADYLTSSKTRGMSKYAMDMISNIITTKQTRMQILDKISGLKKTALDLQMKEQNRNDKIVKNEDTETGLAMSYFNNIIGYGRNNFVKELTGIGQNPQEMNQQASIDMTEALTQNIMNYPDIDSDEYTDLQTEIDSALDEANTEKAEQLKREGIKYDMNMRSDIGNKYIQYENDNAQIVVIYYEDVDNYTFAAMDGDGNMIDGYPVPEDLTDIKFSVDKRYATDDYGRSYRVITEQKYEDDDVYASEIEEI